MCGILGAVNYNITDDILSLLNHRGPDGSGLVRFNLGNNILSIGHTRLSIIDLTGAGRQPMSTRCGNYIITYNGEIYNHLDLRKELNDITFNGRSDTETILYYLTRNGISSIKKLNGIFAFALLDKITGRLYLARDPFGVKPLYYYQKDDKFIFSSEIRPVIKLVDAVLNKNNLAELLRLRYNPSPDTLFDNISKLRPGHVLEYNLNNHNLNVSSYLEAVNTDESLSFDDALEKYELYFEKAVKNQLMSDVELGILLSGGIDSALIAKYSQKHYHKKIKTFTVGFDGKDYSDETAEARKTAGIIGTEHNDIKISADEFDRIFEKSINIIEEPLGTTSVIPMYYLNELVSGYVKVVLSGQGADEPLGGYPRYQGELFRKFIPSTLLKAARPLSKFFKNEKIFRALNSLHEDNIIKRFDNTYALFSNDRIYSLTGLKENASTEKILYFYDLLKLNSRDPVEALMSLDCRMNLADDLLLYTDKISMHFSIEARVPMLDIELMRFIESLPYKYRVRIGRTKIIHKKFAAKSLPPEIINRPKKGFQSPTERWFKGREGRKYLDMISSKNCKFSNYFNNDEIKKIFTDHFQSKRNYEKQIFTLISLYYWMENFL